MKFTAISNILVCAVAIFTLLIIGNTKQKFNCKSKPEYAVAITGNP